MSDEKDKGGNQPPPKDNDPPPAPDPRYFRRSEDAPQKR